MLEFWLAIQAGGTELCARIEWVENVCVSPIRVVGHVDDYLIGQAGARARDDHAGAN